MEEDGSLEEIETLRKNQAVTKKQSLDESGEENYSDPEGIS